MTTAAKMRVINAKKQQDKQMLEKDWNVICIHKRPHSPATNMLDLGVWMALQSVVEKLHQN